MAEQHTGQWQEAGVSHEIIVETPEALPSAKFFKHVSDVVWASAEPLLFDETTVRLDSVLPLESAVGMASTAVYAVDERLALTGGTEPLVMRGYGNLRGFIPASRLVAPDFAFIETKNEDRAERRMPSEDNGHREVLFTDGHVDYSRYLTMGFLYDFGDDQLVLSYNMHRSEPHQDETIPLTVRAWFSPLAVRGYDQGELISARALSPAEETRLLGVIAVIGGLSIRSPGSV